MSTVTDDNVRSLLVSYARRLIDLDEQIDGLREDRKDLLREIAGKGFDKQLFTQAVKIVREESAPAFRDKVALTETYLDALSDFATTPLGAASDRRRDAHMHA